MSKKIKCKIRLHLRTKEVVTGPYESITQAKEMLKYWEGPYTIVKETEPLYKHIGVCI